MKRKKYVKEIADKYKLFTIFYSNDMNFLTKVKFVLVDKEDENNKYIEEILGHKIKSKSHFKELRIKFVSKGSNYIRELKKQLKLFEENYD